MFICASTEKETKNFYASYIEIGTKAYVKFNDNSIHECRVEKVVGKENCDNVFRFQTYWKIAGVKGLVSQSDIDNFGSVRCTMDAAKTANPKSCSDLPKCNGAWYFIDEILDFGFVNGETFYRRGYNGFYATYNRLCANGEVKEEEHAGICVEITKNGTRCYIEEETRQRIGKDLFFTRQNAIDKFNPKVYTFDYEEQETKEVEKIVTFEITLGVKVNSNSNEEDTIAAAMDRLRTCDDEVLFDSCISCKNHPNQ